MRLPARSADPCLHRLHAPARPTVLAPRESFMTRAHDLRWILAASALVSACGTTPATPGDGGTTDATSDAASPDGAATGGAISGTFQVQLVAPSGTTPGYTNVVGRVQLGETPETTAWTEALTDGDCRVLTPRIPFCATPCGSTAACVADNTCRPYPTSQSAGTVRMTGLRTASGAMPIELTLVANNYQPPGSVTLPFPAFSEGDALRIEAGGAGAIPAFAVDGRGIAALTVMSTMLQVAPNTPVELQWTAPGAMGPGSRVKVKLDISHHGGTRGMISCETADDGSLTIGAGLVTRLVGLGVAGFPSIVVTRENVGSANVGTGRVHMVVSSTVERYVTVPGVRSCTSNDDCMGMGNCRADLTCG